MKSNVVSNQSVYITNKRERKYRIDKAFCPRPVSKPSPVSRFETARLRMKLRHGTQVTCWETLEWAKMESLLQLNLENFPDARRGYYQRESGWTAIDGVKEMSLASGIKFHPLPSPPPTLSRRLALFPFVPVSLSIFIFIPFSWREPARARMPTGSSAIPLPLGLELISYSSP